jgi:hypothetical protein
MRFMLRATYGMAGSFYTLYLPAGARIPLGISPRVLAAAWRARIGSNCVGTSRVQPAWARSDQIESAQLGSRRTVLDRVGLNRAGPDWIGTSRIGLDRIKPGRIIFGLERAKLKRALNCCLNKILNGDYRRFCND